MKYDPNKTGPRGAVEDYKNPLTVLRDVKEHIAREREDLFVKSSRIERSIRICEERLLDIDAAIMTAMEQKRKEHM